jgi:prevent-host-death family protein
MERIGLRELRQNASKYLERVKEGESFEVTQRGVSVAMLTPAAKPSLYDRLVAEGKIFPGRQNWGEVFEKNPPLTSENPRSASEFLQELREDRPL